MSRDMILSCPVVSEKRVSIMKANIISWLSRESLVDLAKAFNGETPENAKPTALANWYLEFSNRWDFRGMQKQAYDKKIGEGARWLLSSDKLSEYQKQITMTTALDLGLVNNGKPAGNEYDFVWVLGGAKLSCLLRSRLVKKLIEDKQITSKCVVFLASKRPIGDAEREATNTYAPDAKTEFDLFVASAQMEFGVSTDFSEERYDDEANENNSWIVRRYPINNCNVVIIAAPSSEPTKRRANSADTYKFFMDKFQIPEETSILLSTSQIYVPYQHLEAVRTIAIPYKITLDTIGFPAEWGGTLQGMNEPSNYLQEIRSTIQSIGRFINEYGSL